MTLTRKVGSTAESHCFGDMECIYLIYWVKITDLKPDFMVMRLLEKGCTTQCI